MPKIVYIASKTLARFHSSKAFYRGIMGPVGSGKSTGCCMEIMRRGCQQKSDSSQIRKSRWAVVRNTYRELSDTTIKTWQDWFPEDNFGPVKSDMDHNISISLPDGTSLQMEVLFRALDRPQDIKKLLSLELTGAWVNEAREIPKGIIDGLGDRVGRYPAVRDGGCTWRGVIMDTNPPDDDHWWYRMAENEKPSGWEFFRQPGGLIEINGKFVDNPDAENLGNLEPDYYSIRKEGKDVDYIRAYYCAQYGFVREGKPVHPEYVDAVHCYPEDLEPIPNSTIYIGLDFGLTPAAVFAQRLANGRWIFIDELVSEDMGIKRFGQLLLLPKLQGEYAGYTFSIHGDPAGDERAQTDENTVYEILESLGIKAEPCYTNDPTIRRGALEAPLTRMIEGKPGAYVSPKCKIFRKGLAGGFCYKRLKIAGDERYQDKPVKNAYSHVVEAGEYCMVGAGEGEALTNTPKNSDADNYNKYKIRTRGGPNGWMANY
jgi:hypothetical protein